MQNAPGKGFLKVTGILFIVFGAIAAISSLVIIAGGGLLAGMGDAAGLDGFGVVGGGIAIALGIYTLIMSAFNIVVGIIGVKNCENLEKAQLCFILGCVLIGMQTVGAIISSSLGLTTIIGLVLPVLFLIGAIKNKNASQES